MTHFYSLVEKKTHFLSKLSLFTPQLAYLYHVRLKKYHEKQQKLG